MVWSLALLFFQGGQVKNYLIETPTVLTDMLFANASLTCSEVADLTEDSFDPRRYSNNQYFSIQSQTGSMLAWRNNEYLYHINSRNLGDIKPQNLEQKFLSHALTQEDIKMVTVVGEAGTGKTLMTIAAALEMVYTQKRYERLVLTKPRTQVTDGDEPMGELPGDMLEKMAPQMASYESAMRKAWGSNWQYMFEQMLANDTVQIMPLEHMRGVNFDNAIVICDEAQNVGFKQYKTLVTRMDDSSKLICMGDVRQVDRTHVSDVPIMGIAHHEFYNQSELTAYIELTDVERGPLVDLMIRISNDRDS